jgi:hypothetical protein
MPLNSRGVKPPLEGEGHNCDVPCDQVGLATFNLDNPVLAADGIDLVRGSASLVRATA